MFKKIKRFFQDNFNSNYGEKIGEKFLCMASFWWSFILILPIETFAMSKKAFKEACGGLYKKGLISIENERIRMRH